MFTWAGPSGGQGFAIELLGQLEADGDADQHPEPRLLGHECAQRAPGARAIVAAARPARRWLRGPAPNQPPSDSASASTRWRPGAAWVTISWAWPKRRVAQRLHGRVDLLRGVPAAGHAAHPNAAPAPGGHRRRAPAQGSCQPPRISTAMSETSVGVRPTRTPLASSASALAWAVPDVPDTIAPAWPIVLPGGAVKPAM